MFDLAFLGGLAILFILAWIYDDPTCNHDHDFNGPDAMPVFCDGILVGMYCAHPGCTVMQLEEKSYAEVK